MIVGRPCRFSLFPTTCVLGIGLLLQACGKDAAAGDYKPLKARAAMSDAQLRDLIVETLDADDALKNLHLQVRARSRNGEVILSGRVKSDALRLRAMDVVRSVDPEILLTDEIIVDTRS